MTERAPWKCVECDSDLGDAFGPLCMFCKERELREYEEEAPR